MLYNKVEICGVNTSNLKVLSESEKMRLLGEMHKGNAGPGMNWSTAISG